MGSSAVREVGNKLGDSGWAPLIAYRRSRSPSFYYSPGWWGLTWHLVLWFSSVQNDLWYDDPPSVPNIIMCNSVVRGPEYCSMIAPIDIRPRDFGTVVNRLASSPCITCVNLWWNSKSNHVQYLVIHSSAIAVLYLISFDGLQLECRSYATIVRPGGIDSADREWLSALRFSSSFIQKIWRM